MAQKVYVGLSPVPQRSALATGQAGGVSGETVFVGLSGGVDSAVSAALLKEQGYDIIGAYIKIWQPEFIECTWKEDRLDAMRVCVALGIPFREIDLSAEYKKDVVEGMIADYARGITPNPDVLCNRHIKFGAFADWAFSEGADTIATGHYAQVKQAGSHFELLRAKDAAKDQSYFLYRLDQPMLSKALFPVGALLKTQVRQLAKRFALPVAEKPDSQGLCFVGEVTMPEFLSRFISLESGPVVDAKGNRVGTHHGAALYTLGQRHGFEVEGAGTSRGPSPRRNGLQPRESGPFYVVGVNVATNTLRVSSRREDAARKTVVLSHEHWVSGMPSLPSRYEVQTRYHEKPVFATVARENGTLTATFDEFHLASPGQSIVLYTGDRVIGGAVIVS